MHQVRPQGPLEFNLSPVVRKQLTEVVLGYIGLCDDGAARLGIEWMRDKSRARGGDSAVLAHDLERKTPPKRG